MFSNIFLKSFRILLLPFALLYWLGIAVRNWLFDKKILKSSSFGLPLICVGNLSVGGTGKSPMVEYLVRILQDIFPSLHSAVAINEEPEATLWANETSTALDIGDEPMQFYLKFPGLPVAVGEERMDAIPQLLHDKPATQAIILDDAFQHRSVKAGLNIVLTEYNNIFTRDFYLPTGDLRDLKSSYKRAQIIVVTKCDPAISENERQKIIKEINPKPGQSIFFSAIEYGEMYHINTKKNYRLDGKEEVLLITGIANPRPLKALLEEHTKTYNFIQYPDHHIFTIDDLKEIRKKFRQIESPDKIIITTEKDAVRLIKFNTDLADLPLYVIPVWHHFLFGEAGKFNELVINFINNFRQVE